MRSPSLALNRARHLAGFLAGSFTCAALLAPQAASAGPCTFLQPIGGSGPIVKKRVQRPKGPIGSTIGRTNWNTDFAVDRSYSSYKLFFTADSTDQGSYPIEAYLKFTDGSNLRIVQETMKPALGTGKMFGPFKAVQGKRVSQVNIKVGTAKEPGSTGFSYRISVQGCR
nr:hypothetical protein [Cyanobium sp. PCC 7001]